MDADGEDLLLIFQAHPLLGDSKERAAFVGFLLRLSSAFGVTHHLYKPISCTTSAKLFFSLFN